MKLVVTTSSKLMVLSKEGYVIGFNRSIKTEGHVHYTYYPALTEFDDLLQFFDLITDPELKWGITVNKPIENVFTMKEASSIMNFKEIDLVKEHPEYFI